MSVIEPADDRPPDVLTVTEPAELLRMSPEQIRDLARRGKIPAGKVGEAWRFSRRALLRMVGDDAD
jgi:excisionase family DNA binding protein